MNKHRWLLRRETPGGIRAAATALAILLMVVMPSLQASAQADQGSPNENDILLRALQTELARSKSQLKMDGAEAPYFIEYRVVDINRYEARAAFGAMTSEARGRARLVRAVVRVGNYKDDSYFGRGQGEANLIGLDDDMLALRHQLWLLTDQAYKNAVEALAAKHAALKQFNVEHPVDDFSAAPPIHSIGPLVSLNVDVQPWRDTVLAASALYTKYPDIQSLDAFVIFSSQNEYLVNTEGTVVLQGRNLFQLGLSAYAQAADGLYLVRSPAHATTKIADLPSREKYLAETAGILESLEKMRQAPQVEEEYRGPVIFEPDASNDVMAALIGRNILGIRPRPGSDARTTGEFAESFKSRVLPNFVSVIDDATRADFQGHPLIGYYEVDEEGVRAQRVPAIENGELTHYLLGRQPIRDFPTSNGHARAQMAGPPVPSLGNLILTSTEAMSRQDLKGKLQELCRAQGKPYGYLVRTVVSQSLYPLLLYRVYASDGHEELVRGGVFQELDPRALRNNLIAVGNDAEASENSAGVPFSIVCPSLLFDELEVKRNESGKQKLPEYPPPTFSSPSK